MPCASKVRGEKYVGKASRVYSIHAGYKIRKPYGHRKSVGWLCFTAYKRADRASDCKIDCLPRNASSFPDQAR
jgi:hypothetical protein